MPKWLVTGGCGFIGAHLVRALLAQGADIRVLDDLSTGRRENLPPGVELLEGDVADPEMVGRGLSGVAGCFHLAAIASVQRCTEAWVQSHRTNLTGTLTIFERIAKTAVPAIPVVYASSAAVYGNNEMLPLTEESQTAPVSAYGADKLACELNGLVAWKSHQLPNTGLRFFNVYGKGQDPGSPYSGVITLFADRLFHGKELPIFGDGDQSRDFVHVEDVVAHLLAAMRRLEHGASVYNVCTGRSVTVLELARTLAELMGVKPDIQFKPPRPADIRRSLGSPAKAVAALGVTASTTLRDGLWLTFGERIRA